jgi:hypothetical protein
MGTRTYYPRARVYLEVLLEDFAGGADQQLHPLEAVPVDVEVVRNHHREADTARIELEYSQFPLDPRTIRAAQVVVLMGNVSSPGDELALTSTEHRVFLGFVDEPQITLDEDGDSVVLEARDATALWLDYRWPSGAGIDIARPLSDVVDEFLATVPGVAAMTVEWSEGAAVTVLADIVGRTKWSPQPGDDSWTLLVELLGLAGMIPVVELDKLAVKAAADVRTTTAQFVYGSNVARLTYRRRLHKARSGQVLVRCWDEQAREMRESIYPATPATTRTKVGVDGKVATESDPIMPYYVSGSLSQADLDALAASVYEQAARKQIEGEVETYDLTDLHELTNLWLLGNGDQLEVRLGRTESYYLEGMSHGEAVAWLEGEGWASDVAEAYVSSREQAESLATSFYVRRATHRWSRTDGYSGRYEFINYV